MNYHLSLNIAINNSFNVSKYKIFCFVLKDSIATLDYNL